MKKAVWMLCIVLLLTVLLVGCTQAASPEPSADPQKPSAQIGSAPAPDDPAPASIENPPAPDEADGMYLLVNGTRLELGMPYADVKDGLGTQTAPDQELSSCDDPSYVRIVHFYPGLTVTEAPDGVICGMELSSLFDGETDAALNGAVSLGTTLDAALAALGEPENVSSIKDDCMLIYRSDGLDVWIFLDADGNHTVSGISMTLV